MVARRLAAALLPIALLLGTRPASAQGWQELEDLRFQVETPWPTQLRKGYFPVWIEIENRSDQPCVAALKTESFGWRAATLEAVKTVRLEPGQHRSLELFTPSFFGNARFGQAGYALTVEVDGRRVSTQFGVGSGGRDTRMRTVMLFRARWPEVGMEARFAELLQTAELEDSPQALRGTMVPTGAGASKTNVRAGTARFDRLARSYESYTSLDAVVLDLGAGEPRARDLDGLLAWVRVGGNLVVVGARAREFARSLPALEGWLEERFLLQDEDAYQCGLGRVYLADPVGEELSASPGAIDLIKRALDPLPGQLDAPWIPDRSTWSRTRSNLFIPGIGELPVRTFMVLLCVFAFLIGPFNFALVKRSRRPGLLLVTIPALAALASIAILSYGILHQGIDVRSASHSLTLLDQRAHRAVTLERRAIYVGLSPGPGLRPANGTSVYPESFDDETATFRVDTNEGLLLAGSYLPVRDPLNQILISERAERQRMHVRREGGELMVQNAMPVAVEHMLVRDQDGRFFGLSAPLAPGDSASMSPSDLSGSSEELAHFLLGEEAGPTSDLLTDRGLVPSSYLAVLARSLFTDACGLEANEIHGRHLVMGILPEREEAWD